MPDAPKSDTVMWAQQLQRLRFTATNQALGLYLRGCADVAMARTPQQALAALHKTQTDLLQTFGTTRSPRPRNFGASRTPNCSNFDRVARSGA